MIIFAQTLCAWYVCMRIYIFRCSIRMNRKRMWHTLVAKPCIRNVLHVSIKCAKRARDLRETSGRELIETSVGGKWYFDVSTTRQYTRCDYMLVCVFVCLCINVNVCVYANGITANITLQWFPYTDHRSQRGVAGWKICSHISVVVGPGYYYYHCFSTLIEYSCYLYIV